MESSWARRDFDKEARIYNALGTTLNRIIEAEGASNAVVIASCGEFFTQVLASLSVESRERDEQIEQRLTLYGEGLSASVRRKVQQLRERGGLATRPADNPQIPE